MFWDQEDGADEDKESNEHEMVFERQECGIEHKSGDNPENEFVDVHLSFFFFAHFGQRLISW